MKRSIAAALVAAVTAFAVPAQRIDAAPQVINHAGAPIQLEVSKGQLIRLDRPASSIFVANPEIADVQVKSPSLVYVLGKAPGETTLYAVGDREEVLLNAAVVVTHNLARLQQALVQLAPTSNVAVSVIGDQLVLDGNVLTAAEAEEIRRIAARFVPDEKNLVNKLKVQAPTQVNLRVRVAEMSREVIKQFGFNWDAAFRSGNFLFGLATGNPVVAGGALFPPAGSGRTFLTRNDQTNSFFGNYTSGSVDLNVLIDALDREGLVTVLAEPNLTAISGETASFLAGGEFPIPVPQDANTITIEFKKFGVSLAFVATIIGERINLRVKPEVSQLSSSGAIIVNSISVPSLTTRRAETTIELGSGQSFAIAGLLQNNITQDIRKFPWLGDVPVLGTLFRSDRFQRNESELVIIVTPYLVQPVSAKRLLAPTDGYVPPSDAARLLDAANYRPQLVNQGNAPVGKGGTTLIGPAGFDID